MMKRVVLWMLVVSMVGLLLGCVSARVPEKTSDDEGLVVIKTKVKNPDDVDVLGRYYHLNVSGHEDIYPLPKYDEGTLHIKVRNDDTKIESISTGVSSDYKGKKIVKKVGAQLPYVPGEVIVYDLVCIQVFEEVSENRYKSGAGFVPISKEEKKELQQEITENEAYAGWR